MDNGWIKIYRKFSDWEWFKISEMVHLFIFLLINCNHKDNKWQGINIKRGQIITGRKELSFKTGISEQTIRTCLKKLELTKEITVKSTNKYSIITVCNYDSYQDKTEITNQQLTNNQPATNQQLTTNKNDKNKKNDKNIFIPPSLLDVIEYCKERKNNVDAEAWINHYTAKGWMIGKNKMKDWKAAVRTWEKSNKEQSIVNKPLNFVR